MMRCHPIRGLLLALGALLLLAPAAPASAQEALAQDVYGTLTCVLVGDEGIFRVGLFQSSHQLLAGSPVGQPCTRTLAALRDRGLEVGEADPDEVGLFFSAGTGMIRLQTARLGSSGAEVLVFDVRGKANDIPTERHVEVILVCDALSESGPLVVKHFDASRPGFGRDPAGESCMDVLSELSELGLEAGQETPFQPKTEIDIPECLIWDLMGPDVFPP